MKSQTSFIKLSNFTGKVMQRPSRRKNYANFLIQLCQRSPTFVAAEERKYAMFSVQISVIYFKDGINLRPFPLPGVELLGTKLVLEYRALYF